MPASQSYLDATRNGAFVSPDGWDTLAQAWEDDVAYVEADAEAWVNVFIESPAVVTALIARGLSPTDIAFLKAWLDPNNLPALETAVAAIGIMKGFAAAGLEPGQDSLNTLLSTFFTELSDASIGLVVN